MEVLFAELLLWYVGFHSSERYNALLDEQFLSDSENGLYLELEGYATNLLDSMGRFKRYWDYECSEFNRDLFGKQLFEGLKFSYDRNCYELSVFGNRCCKLWHMLPDSIKQIEPFHSLIYADEPLSWGDEMQTRELYEKAFQYYDE